MPKVFVYRTSVVFVRAFMTVFLVGVGMGTWTLVRDWTSLSADNQRFGAGLMALMWLCGVPVWYSFSFKQPTVRLSVLGLERLQLVRATLLKRDVTTLTAGDLERVELIEGRDGDGDPYYKGVLTLKPRAERVPFIEGSDRGQVLEAINAVREAVEMPASG